MSPAFGVYPIADALPASDHQISSTYEGRHVTLTAAELLTSAGSGVATKGLPCVFGLTGLQGVGVCLTSGTLTDLIAIDTEGIWNLDVHAEDDGGAGSAVAGGDLLYINVATGVISKISNQATQIPFGIAYGIITAGNTERIAVKVHFDPSLDNAKRTYMTVATGAYVYGKHHTSIFAGGESTGLEYFDQQVTGQQTGNIYGWGSWVELASGFIADASLLVAGEFGIYDAGGDLTLSWIVMMQLQAILASNPATLNIFRINIAAAGGAIDAIFAAANPASLGYVAAVTEADPPVGYIPFATIVGFGTVYIRLYADMD